MKQCETVDPKSGKLSRTLRPHQPWWQIPASFHRSARGQPVGINELADSTREIGRAYGAHLSTKLEAKEPKNPLTKKWILSANVKLQACLMSRFIDERIVYMAEEEKWDLNANSKSKCKQNPPTKRVSRFLWHHLPPADMFFHLLPFFLRENSSAIGPSHSKAMTLDWSWLFYDIYGFICFIYA